MTGKIKCTVVWPAMFFSGFKLQPEKITTGKKGTVELSDRPFFPAGSKFNKKKLPPDKKVQSSGRWRRLRFGGNVTTRRKKMYSCLAGYIFQRVQITTGKKYDQKEKVHLSGQPFFLVIIFSGRNLIDEEAHQKT